MKNFGSFYSMKNVDLKYDKNTFLTGQVIEDDASFDHAFGTECRTSYYLNEFCIISYTNGEAEDVTIQTQKESPYLFELLKEDLLEKYVNDAEYTNFLY